MKIKFLAFILPFLLINGCSTSEEQDVIVNPDETEESIVNDDYPAFNSQFGDHIDLNDLPNYANQDIPNYVNEDNTGNNQITDEGSVLGRVLFYDVNLSSNNTISCASCHKQNVAFGDDAIASTGVNGTTGRHSMRLVNARFSEESRFFWDERANTLEEQTTMPIQDHIEMGFSGADGDQTFTDLIAKLEAIEYYQELFTFVYGDTNITEARMQDALAQFVRSIQSFDSKYDIGRAQVNSNNDNFPNFTNQENLGKELFMRPANLNNNGLRVGGGIGCNTCHQAPEFGIDNNSDNNGVIETIAGNENDFSVTRSPSLRDLINPSGEANGPFMHNGFSSDFEDVLDHYGNIEGNIPNLDRRLRNGGDGQILAMTQDEMDAVFAFIQTLTGSNIYSEEKWSDPFSD